MSIKLFEIIKQNYIIAPHLPWKSYWDTKDTAIQVTLGALGND